MNNFIIAGKLLDNGEKLETAEGLKICRLKVAVEKSSKKDEAEDDIFEVTLFRNLAEDNYQAGNCVAINGRLVSNNYAKEGNQYYSSRLVGNSITIFNP